MVGIHNIILPHIIFLPHNIILPHNSILPHIIILPHNTTTTYRRIAVHDWEKGLLYIHNTTQIIMNNDPEITNVSIHTSTPFHEICSHNNFRYYTSCRNSKVNSAIP